MKQGISDQTFVLTCTTSEAFLAWETPIDRQRFLFFLPPSMKIEILIGPEKLRCSSLRELTMNCKNISPGKSVVMTINSTPIALAIIFKLKIFRHYWLKRDITQRIISG